MSKEEPPKEPIGDKKEEQKMSAKDEIHESISELKKSEKKTSWLKEKFDKWRENE